MEEFELFKQAFLEYTNMEGKNEEKDECEHLDINEDNGATICMDCGKEIKRDINFGKEWRYYGADDTRRNADPNRCQVRKTEEKSIFKDVEGMGHSDKIVNIANDIYMQVTGGKIHRGKSRKSIVFACIFQAYKLINKPQTHEELQKQFNLKRKAVLKGIKFVSLNVPKDSPIRTRYITPADFVEEIMNRFKSTDEQKKEVIVLYERVKDRSRLLNRSRPQSFAAGLIYYWITEYDEKITIDDFSLKVGLSKITIDKISKEVGKLLN